MTKPRAAAKKPRVRRNPEEARQNILAAAVRTLSKHGPEACGLKEVAAEAGISHALITHYFGTYEALVEAAISEAMRELRERLLDKLTSMPKPSAETMVQLYFDIALEPWYGRLVNWVFFHDVDASSTHVKQLVPQMKPILTAAEEMFRESAGLTLSREQVETILVCVWSLVVGYVTGNAFFWHAFGRKPSPARDRAVRDALSSFARNLAP